MNIFNMRELIKKVIADLSDDKPIQGILLKVQVIAHKLHNEEFIQWVHQEQNGYSDVKNLPEYRILDAIVKADIQIPFMGYMQNYTIPAGIYEDDKINTLMSRVYVTQSLYEIEQLCAQGNKGHLIKPLHAMAYAEVNKYVSGDVQRVWQELSVSSLLGVHNNFKSKLLAFFLDMEDQIEGGLDFSSIESQQKISQMVTNNYINATIANVGSGNVTTGDVTNNNVYQTITLDSEKDSIKAILAQIEELVQEEGDSEMNEVYTAIQQEVEKNSWGKKTLKMALNALKGIANGVIVNKITPLVDEVLALLS